MMKHLHTLFFLIFIVVFGFNVNAQLIGARVGLNIPSMVIKDNDGTYTNDAVIKFGIHLGPVIEIPISDIILLETGLLVSTKGINMHEEEVIFEQKYSFKERINLLYIDIPVTAKVYHELAGQKVFGIIGPCISLALDGKVKAEEVFMGDTDSVTFELEFGNDENRDDLRRLDIGLQIGVGIEINSIQVGVNYILGLANVSAARQDGATILNRVFSISAKYNFLELN